MNGCWFNKDVNKQYMKKTILALLLIPLLQSCAIYENFDDPFEGLIEGWMDGMYQKHGPDPIMSGYELMEKRIQAWPPR